MPLPTTRSYVSNDDADDYFVHTMRGTEWGALSTGEKTLSLQEATRWLETLCYKGEKCSSTQTFKWPRKNASSDCCSEVVCTTLPPKMVEATCELALALHNNPTSLLGGGPAASTTGSVKRQKLGDLEQEFFEPSSGDSRYGPSDPMVLQVYPWLGDLLGECYLQGSFGSSRILARVRS